MSEVKHYWPEEIVGTGELVVYLADYAALEAENARLVERTGYLVEFAQQMARRQGEPYYRLLAKAALRRQNEIQRAEIDALIDELHVARIWRDTLEQMLVTTGVGVAKESASRAEVEATINRLIDWHIAMANDPRTTGVSA